MKSAMRLTTTLALLTLGGCATNHYGEGVLFRENGEGTPEIPADTLFEDQRFTSNVVFVRDDEDAPFSIQLDAINPGWIHQDNSFFGEGSTATSDSDTHWKADVSEHLKGKEVWVFATIRSKNPNDVLELDSKVYFKTSNVKFQAESFRLIPLDESEIVLFKHSPDSAYDIDLRVYEVDGFTLKRAFVGGVENAPGLSGVAKDLYDTGKALLGDLAGDLLVEGVKSGLGYPEKDKEEFWHRLILQFGGSLELRARISVVRNNRNAVKPECVFALNDVSENDAYYTGTGCEDKKGWFANQRVVLFDPVKENVVNGGCRRASADAYADCQRSLATHYGELESLKEISPTSTFAMLRVVQTKPAVKETKASDELVSMLSALNTEACKDWLAAQGDNPCQDFAQRIEAIADPASPDAAATQMIARMIRQHEAIKND